MQSDAAIEGYIESQQLLLRDDRRLGFAEYGAPDGCVVFYFHGFPGSRLEARLLDRPARELGARIIAVDRPGCGRSDVQPARTLGEWPDDVLALADALRIERFSVLGVSGGGPYALACAALLAERLRAVATVCGLGPLHLAHSTQGMSRLRQISCALLREMRWLTRPAYALMARRIARDIELVFEDLLTEVPPVDQTVLRRPEVREVLTASFREGIRHGATGGARDLRLYLSPWDFALDRIIVPVTLWHGELDTIVPATMGRELAGSIPHCEAIFLPEEGHYSLPINHTRPILARLLETNR
ncbi:alpha/beta fold hydrolase [Verrucomicrobiota bacterium sgz303538]